ARSHLNKDADFDKRQGHLILLAENEQGYKNLIKIVSIGYTEGYYYKPRIDKDVLRAHSEGLICLSACLSGEVQRRLLHRDYAGAREEAMALRDIFGEGNFYLELQDHDLDEERAIRADMLKLADELGLPVAATNDVHYVNRSDAEPHDVLLCIQTGSVLSDEDRMRYPNDQFYLKSEQEMRELFKDLPEAVDNTEVIAGRCSFDFKFGEYHLPEFIAPDGLTNEEYFRELCDKGLTERYGERASSRELRERLDYEIDTIVKMGYVEYFLIVWDFINYAKENGIMVGPGRGSAAGSIVAYSLKITDIDPIRYNLIFERFLNPERVIMPDIDVDFCYERRGEVIDYVTAKYGKERVSQIITFGTMKAKQAVRDVARVLGATYQMADQIAKAIPFELDMTLKKALNMPGSELRPLYEGDREIKRIVDMAMALEGMPRHASTHAAGVVISKLPIDEYVPLYMSEKGAATQFTMTTIEELGLLKMDFLGLRNLTVIRDALEMIERDHGVRIDFSKMGYDDPGVYEMIASGNTSGVFQLESGGMTQFMKNLKPTCFEDIVAGISLYRPGPMDSIPKYIENKKHPEKISYVTERLAPILDVTYGCLVYQEQVMQIVRDLGGYSYGRSDLVRRAMSKKKHKVMMEEKEFFINGKLDQDGNVEIPGCIRNGIDRQAAETIFEDMVTFASYAFNKSHAAAYAVVAYETGYLKKYYPTEFMAALMTSVMGDPRQIARYIRNSIDMGIEVLPPDVNRSFKKFTVSDGKIRFGLLGVKNVGEGAIEAIVNAREKKGLPKNIFGFINNVDVSQVNKKTVESLIKAGAMDCFTTNKAAMLSCYESLMESAQNEAKNNIEGQISLFDLGDSSGESSYSIDVGTKLPDVKPFSKEISMSMEKEMLGVYLSDHPLNDYVKQMKRLSSISCEDLMHAEEDMASGDINTRIRDNMKCSICGIVTNRKTQITKSGSMMAFIGIEDLYGTAEIVVFPKVYERVSQMTEVDKVIMVRGTLNFKEDEAPKILADDITEIRPDSALIEDEAAENRYINGAYETAERLNGEPKEDSPGSTPMREPEVMIKIRIPRDMDDRITMDMIGTALARHRGETPVKVLMYLPSGRTVRSDMMLDHKGSLKNQLIGLLGSENVKF
ncbi:MAG: DNA polymerase III subunit alpha, partial [Firmicutes bacterium]|nr:DNA polymerase III subunit alpha [Bacillota bacterium]